MSASDASVGMLPAFLARRLFSRASAAPTYESSGMHTINGFLVSFRENHRF